MKLMVEMVMGDLLEIQNQIETWSECGLAPRWRAALIAQGKAKEDFAIKR